MHLFLPGHEGQAESYHRHSAYKACSGNRECTYFQASNTWIAPVSINTGVGFTDGWVFLPWESQIAHSQVFQPGDQESRRTNMWVHCCLFALFPDSHTRPTKWHLTPSWLSNHVPATFLFLRVYPQNPRDLPAEILSAAYGQGEAPSGQVPDKYPMMLGEVILRKSNKKLKSWYAAQQAKEQQKVAQPTPQPASSAPSPSTYGQFSMADMMAGFMHFPQAMQRNMHQSPNKLQPSGDRLALTNCQTTPSVDQGSAQQFEPKLRHPQKSAHVPTSLPIEDKKAEAHSEVNATQEAHGNTPKGNPPQTEQPQHTGRDVEEAAFTALKSKKGIAQAKAKSNAKAKAKGTPKAKGKAKAQAKSAASSSCRKRPASKISQPMPFTYEPGEPEERWDGKYDSWCSKHYHTCRNMAVNAGYDDDEAKELGKEARKKATLLYKKVFGWMMFDEETLAHQWLKSGLPKVPFWHERSRCGGKWVAWDWAMWISSLSYELVLLPWG